MFSKVSKRYYEFEISLVVQGNLTEKELAQQDRASAY